MSLFIKQSLKICQGQLENGLSGTVAFWVVSSRMLKGEAPSQSVQKKTAWRTLLTHASSPSRESRQTSKTFLSKKKKKERKLSYLLANGALRRSPLSEAPGASWETHSDTPVCHRTEW